MAEYRLIATITDNEPVFNLQRKSTAEERGKTCDLGWWTIAKVTSQQEAIELIQHIEQEPIISDRS